MKQKIVDFQSIQYTRSKYKQKEKYTRHLIPKNLFMNSIKILKISVVKFIKDWCGKSHNKEQEGKVIILLLFQ